MAQVGKRIAKQKNPQNLTEKKALQGRGSSIFIFFFFGVGVG